MNSSPPNVVWITLESVRAANTSVGGYERDTTPNLSRIANGESAVAFQRCFSQSMWTPASSASILTGTYLFEHRVGYDGKAKEPLPYDVTTLPALLGEKGYQTACLSPTSYLSEATGLDRGFDDFRFLLLNTLFHESDTRIPTLKYFLNCRRYGPGFSRNYKKHKSSCKTFVMRELLEAWVDSFVADGDPFFLYTHVPNPHLPYTPPRKYIDAFTDDIDYAPGDALDLSLDVYANRDHMIQQIVDGCQFTDAEHDALMAMYDAEIAYADWFVGQLYDYVTSNVDGDTIFVITADHGDLFGEQGILGHNLVLDDHLTHVPMVVSGIDGLEDAADSVIQHIDVTRTVANYLGVDHEQFSGVDLRQTAPDMAVSQRGIPHFDEYLEADPEFDTSRYHPDPVTALRTKDFKYLVSETKSELFALPDEETDVIEAHPTVRDDLDEELKARIQDMRIAESDGREAEYSDSMVQQLTHLGYL